jgi:SAM-dependent methyltransferase
MALNVDFGKTAQDYATHRAGFPDAFVSALSNCGVEWNAKTLVDLGTGTGTLARGFAQRGARVTGIDPSEPMLEQARALARSQQVEAEFRVGRAEATGLASDSVDVVCAGQCWHWFDRSLAAAECRRILKPGGTLVIAHFDWIPLPGNVIAATEALIVEHNPNWRFAGGNGVYGRWFADLSLAGFDDIRSHSHDESVPYSHEAWRGRIRASAGIAASLPPEAVERFDCEHAELLARDFSHEPLQTLHRVFFIVAHSG